MKNKLRIFKDAVAIVTGGASGIGRSLAEELSGRGAKVFIADLQAEIAEEVAAGIVSRGLMASAYHLDVTDFTSVKGLVERVYIESGRLDYIFNNAGIAIFGEALQYSHEDWEKIIDINLKGVIHGIEAAYPIMARQGFGHIVNTASIGGLIITPYLSSYVASKYAVVGLSKTLRVEARPYGVRVSALCPGVIRTPMMEGGKFGKMLVKLTPEIEAQAERLFRPMDPRLFAKKSIDKVAENRGIIIVPAWWKAIWWVGRISEALAFFLCHLQHRDSIRKLGKSM